MQGCEVKERLVAKGPLPLGPFAGGDKSGRHQAGPRFSTVRAGLPASRTCCRAAGSRRQDIFPPSCKREAACVRMQTIKQPRAKQRVVRKYSDALQNLQQLPDILFAERNLFAIVHDKAGHAHHMILVFQRRKMI